MAFEDYGHRETPAAAGGEPPSTGVGKPGLSWKLALARLALWWETLWPALWPAVGLLGLFAVFVLLDLFPRVPGWLHIALLAAFALAFLAGLWRALPRFILPSKAAARRRLELDSALEHRPLQALGDHLASDPKDRASAMLWRMHRQRLLQQIRSLKVRLPRSRLPSADPFALRAVVLLLLVVGLAVGHVDWRERFNRAVTPRLSAQASMARSFDLWIDPPAYTALPPLFLDPASQETIRVAAGSSVLAQVQGEGRPILKLGERELPFEDFAPQAYKLSAEIQEGDSIALQVGSQTLAAWPIEVIPDQAPTVVFPEPPGRSERLALRVPYEAHDDYGVTELTATVRRIDNPTDETIELEIVLPGGPAHDLQGTSYHDLTPHPWAGIAVEITLRATDAIGQQAHSEAFRTVLPERIFNHPVARALVEQRRALTLKPEDRLSVVRVLNNLGDRPSHYFHDTVVALAIYTAARRLINDDSPDAIAQVQQLLWDTALRIEEGELAIAERDLRNIQQALMEALARGADDEEIERMLDELQAALDNFLEALAERMAQQQAEGQEALPPDAEMFDSQDLRELIEKARELARSGSREAAQELLAQLQELLENLRAQPFAEGMMDEATREAHRMMENLEDIMQGQQELMDESFQRSREQGSAQGNEGRQQEADQRDAQSQESLRQQLGELMRQLGEMLGDIPQPLGQAEREMRSSREAFEGREPGQAVEHQARSLDYLQQGLNNMAERFMQMLGEQNRGTGTVANRPGQGQGRDPLGRDSGTGRREAIQGVEIPDEMEIRRSREILDELRRRRGEHLRPRIELDYIDRLLRQF